uniref:Uncharacterized protein n=1 Tax=Anguilla anguilla TaxID=7936 RepID=A0A0E9Q1X9_ANGAN
MDYSPSKGQHRSCHTKTVFCSE